MKKIFIFSVIALISLSSCIDLEDEALLTVAPSVEFKGHIRNNQVYVTAIVHANPTFIESGNIPTILNYTGDIELYDNVTGELLNSTSIEGAGLSSIVDVSASANNFDKIVIIASGTVSVYGDKESDGDASNDVFIYSSDFYEVINLKEVIIIEDYPVVNLTPSVNSQMYIKNGELYTTVTVRANPEYIVTGADPIIFDYDGVLQLYDKDSGILLKSSSLSGDGLANAATLVADTTSFDIFIIIASGTISCFADIESDGDPSNDFFISSAEYEEVFEVPLEGL